MIKPTSQCVDEAHVHTVWKSCRKEIKSVFTATLYLPVYTSNVLMYYKQRSWCKQQVACKSKVIYYCNNGEAMHLGINSEYQGVQHKDIHFLEDKTNVSCINYYTHNLCQLPV